MSIARCQARPRRVERNENAYARHRLPALVPAAQRHYDQTVQPIDIQHIGNELAIRWQDGLEQFIPLRTLRDHCPCAGCKGEVDVLGNLYKNPETRRSDRAYELVRVERVGGYALQPVWGDGHASGLYAFEYLRSIPGESPTAGHGAQKS